VRIVLLGMNKILHAPLSRLRRELVRYAG